MGKLGKFVLAGMCAVGLGGSGCTPTEGDSIRGRSVLGLLLATQGDSPAARVWGIAMHEVAEKEHEEFVEIKGRSNQTTNISIYSSGDVTRFKTADGRTGRIYNRDGRTVTEYDE